MKKIKDLQGCGTALVTPFKANGKLDEEGLRKLVDFQVSEGIDFLVPCGTTGENPTLTLEEHLRVVEIVVEQSRGKVPIIAGAGGYNTAKVIEMASKVADLGVDGLLSVTPYYNKPTQEGLYQHYKRIANKIKIPLIIYNVPSRTGINILPQTVARVYKECKNVVGIKEASGSLDQITKLMSLVDRKFVLLSGSDEITLPILSVGGVGVISVLANIMPSQTHNLVDSFLKDDIDKARKLQVHLYKLIKMLFIETNPIPVKTALGLMGLIKPYLRLPLYRMSKENEVKLKATLREYRIIR